MYFKLKHGQLGIKIYIDDHVHTILYNRWYETCNAIDIWNMFSIWVHRTLFCFKFQSLIIVYNNTEELYFFTATLDPDPIQPRAPTPQNYPVTYNILSKDKHVQSDNEHLLLIWEFPLQWRNHEKGQYRNIRSYIVLCSCSSVLLKPHFWEHFFKKSLNIRAEQNWRNLFL